MKTTIQSTPAWQLSIELTQGRYGHHLRMLGLVPTARRPEEQVRFQATLSRSELLALHEAIDAELRGTEAAEVTEQPA